VESDLGNIGLVPIAARSLALDPGHDFATSLKGIDFDLRPGALEFDPEDVTACWDIAFGCGVVFQQTRALTQKAKALENRLVEALAPTVPCFHLPLQGRCGTHFARRCRATARVTNELRDRLRS
jgi:hypothetical protein